MSITCCEICLEETVSRKVLIEGPVKAADLKRLYLNQNLNNFRPPEKQKEALISISQLPEGIIYVARYNSEIIGYITFHFPDQFSRWSKHPKVLELGALEVCPEWRRYKIGTLLLKKAFSNQIMQEYIVITTEFYWHWDLERNKMGIFDYQRMLSKFFGKVGLKKRNTDDPDIIEHPANVLMVRIGEKTRRKEILMFEDMLYEDKSDIQAEYIYPLRVAGMHESRI
ncbi:MAG: Uncharacterized protein XD97_0428 [Pelotomaculum thermopropionicum]|uniref:N-acetyltransferase domain-containing protein n=1 Tax=Pelotomaculum thermopropionicum TaxID=110500 RepID=A0A101HTA9_9FIRM|nr:MAG: Uncharacterized protein XD97_0428 [Pelotomaculum thermopropionicum]